ncbi:MULTISPECIES: DUF4148 domain-containing protein [Bordetella]|uniref:DUF4148 domain-containing protein n=1 Tax=Bordetella genomosp. 7 TaxID=1416805 RepID=A0A261QUM9_9BORD|nr:MULTISPECIES: DUF4148 domain-containing protein [Bordetella]OZI16227.1 hypothetical protein CAL19_16145 [Bordetella genomosp. 7]
MKTHFAITALTLSVLGLSSYGYAAEETDVPASQSTETRAAVAAELASARSNGQLHDEEQTYVPASHSTLSRDQVAADLAAWNRAGLAQEWQSNLTPDTASAAYQNKQLQYLRYTGTQQIVHLN